MHRRTILKLLGASPLFANVAALAANTATFPEQQFHKAVVIDGLANLTIDDDERPDLTLKPKELDELRRSGLTVISTTVNIPGNDPDCFNKTIGMIAHYEDMIAANPHVLLAARSAADITRAKREGKVALLYNFQDTSAVGIQLDRIDLFKQLGVRIMQLTYNKRNLSGDGALERADAGLSDLGRNTIDKIESSKLLLDLAHGGARTTAEAIAHAKRPMLISHTGCRALNDNPRNAADAELKAVADKGGVVGIYFMPFLVVGGKPTRADVLRHLEHAVNVCGEDHVAIGTDGQSGTFVINDETRAQHKAFFESRKAKGIAAPGEAADVFNLVMDYNDPMRYRMLADDLARAGWSDVRIEKILGANLLRVYGDVWGA